MTPQTIKAFTSALEKFLLELAGGDASTNTTIKNPFEIPNVGASIAIVNGIATYKGKPLTFAQADWLRYVQTNRMPGKTLDDPIPTPAEIEALYRAAFGADA
jgi:hypothetical protein